MKWSSLVSASFATAHRSARRSIIVLAVCAVGVGSCSDSGTGSRPPVGLRFVVQPTTTAAGEAFEVSVEFVTSDDRRATGTVDEVTLALQGGATLSGAATVAAAAGVATFPGLSVTRAGAGYQLTATAGEFTVTSDAFGIDPGAATGDHSTVTVTSQNPGDPLPPAANQPVVVRLRFNDAHGNAIPSAPVSLSTQLSGASFAPGTGTTDVQGAFETTFQSTTLGSAVILATVDGNAITLASPILVSNVCAEVAPLVFPGAVSGSMTEGTCLRSGRPTARYSFATAALGGARFTLTSPFQGVLSVRTDPPGGGITFLLAQSPGTIEWLLPAGAYQVWPGSMGGLGAYTLDGAATAGNSAAVRRALAVPGAYPNQMLEQGDLLLAPDDPSFVDVFDFIAAAPCTITMAGATIIPYLIVGFVGENGFVGIADDGQPEVGPVGVDAQVQLPNGCFESNAALIILATTWPDNAGPYTLTITLQGGAAITLSGQSAAMPMLVPFPGADLGDGRTLGVRRGGSR